MKRGVCCDSEQIERWLVAMQMIPRDHAARLTSGWYLGTRSLPVQCDKVKSALQRDASQKNREPLPPSCPCPAISATWRTASSTRVPFRRDAPFAPRTAGLCSEPEGRLRCDCGCQWIEREKNCRSIKIHHHRQQQSHERAFAHNLPGLQSVSREQMDSNTFEIVSAGLHWSYERAR